MYLWLAILIILAFFGFLFLRYFRYRYAVFYKDEYPQPFDGKPEDIQHSIFLIGDCGAPSLITKDPVLQLLKKRVSVAQEKSTVVFLGDNIYPYGLPPEGDKMRKIAVQRLTKQLELFSDFKGKVFMISGNHDWRRGRIGGYQYVLRQEAFVKEFLKNDDAYLPKGGCPDLEVRLLEENVALVIINTQWWVQRGERPMGSEYGCKISSEEEFFQIFDETLDELKSAGKQVVIAAHHPLFSNSAHGGKFPVKEHVFPLSALHKRLYLPLPLIGSIYPYYRRFLGPMEDMSNPVYKRLRKKLLRSIKKHANIVYAGGHDHNLQYFHLHSNHFIVSGAGSKTTYVKRGGKASFTHRHRGFFEVRFLKNNEVWLLVWEPKPAGGEALVYSKEISG